MAVFKPFKALRPTKEFAEKVAALPYDVMTSAEAKEMVKDNPYSFLHVDKAEIDLPDITDLYSDAVYEKAAENLKKLESDGVLISDSEPHFYLYRQVMDGRAQTGIVGCASVDDYLNNRIKKHELTRAEKEADRIRHVDTCDANTGPIFLCYRGMDEINNLIADYTAAHSPEYNFTADGGVAQTVWVIDDSDLCRKLSELLADVKSFYIADGHHRCASAVKVAQKRRAEKPDYDGTEEFNFFLSVLFPAEELAIMDYNRVVLDLNGMTEFSLLRRLDEMFVVRGPLKEAYRPTEPHTFGMYIDKKWYSLAAKPGTFEAIHPVARLDVSVLQSNVLVRLFNIGDPRVDKRIDFVGGIRGLSELERRVDAAGGVAFSMFPTSLDDLMSIADAKCIMPPKSTWFEPKLLSGLFIHRLS